MAGVGAPHDHRYARNLWVIDDGKQAGISGIPDGAAKVVDFDKVIASVVLKAPALLQDGMNDLRVDLTHGSKGTAYISDSFFGTSPALVGVDLASGAPRRVLAHHVSTQPQAGFVAILDGKLLCYDPKHPMRTKTLPKVRTEISLAVLTYNMKRMIKVVGCQAC